MELNYYWHGDILLPDMGLTAEEQQPLGKYGMIRRHYLEEYRPGLYTQMILCGTLYEHLHEVDRICKERLEHMIPRMAKAEGVDGALKSRDQMEWVRRMNSIKARAEEVLFAEIVYE